ncbi:EamA family transporter [Sporosarcina newyorkensis 2681]|uniref:EamA family transporter n=1 Tax=Sporosarcina newyorkensis 2681 TaxID=1027292 RepID=F9DY36_9BACL|nr:hypothetical protein [Sporosarcina newyorkensis]EGQ19321.1 EamA family transporter [Sporosarcina newyorkensis 2681]
MFFKTKICRNKLYIYPEVEVYVAKQSPAELIELGFLVLETSLLLLRMMDTRNYKKDMRFWTKRISHHVDTIPKLLWEEGEKASHLMIRKQNKKHLTLLRFKISRIIQTLFSFEEDNRAPFKMDQIHVYFGKCDWIKK